MEHRKLIGLVSAALAAGLLVFAAFSNAWIIGEDYDGTRSNVGLRSVDICVEGSSCTNVSLESWSKSAFAPKGLSTFQTLGTISLGLSFALALSMLILIGYGVADKVPYWPVHPGSLALLLSVGVLVVGVLTLALHPFKTSGWGTGPGFLVLAAGDVAALAAALILGKSEPAREEDWFE